MTRLGAIADDYTGAVDLAATIVDQGYRVRVFFGTPDETADAGDADVIVIGLKIRTVPVDHARAATRDAFRALRRMGADRFYSKYSATFDSTPQGNIGPILDTLMDEVGTDRSVVVVPFPEAGRVVTNGLLYVHGVPLNESSMRDHPLTPMADSRIANLLRPQTLRPVHELHTEEILRGAENIRSLIEAHGPGVTVIDASERTHLDLAWEGLSDLSIMSGGAGLFASLPATGAADGQQPFAPVIGRSIILSGSASWETQEQIRQGREHWPSRKLSIEALEADRTTEINSIMEWAEHQWAQLDQPLLVYATDSDSDLTTDPKTRESRASLIEWALGTLARRGLAAGVRHFLIAGGETSGSVTQSLTTSSFDVGRTLTPGTAWSRAVAYGDTEIDILLKSGSLGAPDLFVTAWEALPR